MNARDQTGSDRASITVDMLFRRTRHSESYKRVFELLPALCIIFHVDISILDNVILSAHIRGGT